MYIIIYTIITDAFFQEIVPLYFRHSRLSSFKRQLNLYGFEQINIGPFRGGYYHESFHRDNPDACRRMRRVAVKVVGAMTLKKKEQQEAAAAKAKQASEVDETVTTATAAEKEKESQAAGDSHETTSQKDDVQKETAPHQD